MKKNYSLKLCVLICLLSQGLMAFVYDKEELPKPTELASKPLFTHSPFVNLNLLYWKPRVDGLSSAQSAIIDLDSTNNFAAIKATDLDMHFQWDPGFKVDLGYLFDKKAHYQTVLAWTYFYSTGSDPLVPGSASFAQAPTFSDWIPGILGVYISAVNSKWSLNFNLLDWSLGRDFYLCKQLSMHPEAGIRAAWIYQKYNLNFNALNPNGAGGFASFDTSFDADNDFRGVGIKLGSDLEWHINSCFALVIDGFFSLFYGRFQINEQCQGFIMQSGTSNLTQTTFSLDRGFNAVKMAIETQLGFRWEKFLKEDKYRLRAAIFYQLALWPDQNQLINEIWINPNSTKFSSQLLPNYVQPLPEKGDLQIQGFRFLIGIDF